jgi:hypothetical protein
MPKSKKKQRALKKKVAAAEKEEVVSEKKSQRKNERGSKKAAAYSAFATYKRCTEAVKQWCTAIAGESSTSTLKAWDEAMRSIALKGTPMPHVVAKDLGMAIFFRSQHNEFYARVQRSDPQRHANHVYVCELLRSFQRLFKQPGDRRKVMANQVKQKLGFALLQDDEDEDDEEQQDDAVGETEEGASVEEHGGTSEEKAAESTVHEQEDEETFANACLLSDMHKIRQGIKKLWETHQGEQASDTYLLGLACSTSYRMKMAATVIRSTVLCCPPAIS